MKSQDKMAEDSEGMDKNNALFLMSVKIKVCDTMSQS